jgi:ribosomal protein S6--L-glutamate ligase
MRIAYLGTRGSWYLDDLRRAASTRHEVVLTPYASLHASIVENRLELFSGSLPLRQFDAVLVRSMPLASLEQVVFRMDALAQLDAAGTCVFNSPKAMEAATDKYLASARLAAAGLCTPATHVSQDWRLAMEGFAQLGGDVVVKPLFGGEGRGITRISDPELAQRAFKMLAQIGSAIYQQKFIEHEGCDLRLLVLGEKIWGMKRCNPHDWRTNVSRGAATQPLIVTPELADVARRASSAVGATFAGVDVLLGRDGQQNVIEVNAVPGWQAISQTLKIDIAQELLRYLEARA